LVDPSPISPLPDSPPFPALARFGLAVMALGLLLDFVEHDLVSHVNEQAVVGFPWSEHAAHLVVLVGMVLVLVGIVRDGVRIGRLTTQQNRSSFDAVR
jgi:hypothetical protein